MITVTVAGIEQSLEGLSESWLHEQIKRRQKAGEPVCVQVVVHTPEIKVGVSSAACPMGPGGSRRPKPKEQQVLDLWSQFDLGQGDLNSGKLVAFLQRLRSLV
jgi:hypothetical protein